MFFCRRITPFFTSRLSSVVPTALYVRPRARLSARANHSSTVSLYDAHADWSNEPESTKPDTQRSTDGHSSDSADRLLTKAVAGPSKHPALRDLHNGLQIALQHEQYKVADKLIQGLVEIYRRDSAIRFTIFQEFLCRSDLDKFDSATIASVLDLFNSSPFELKHLDPRVLVQFIENRQETFDESIWLAAMDAMLGHLSTLTVPRGMDTLVFEPTNGIKIAFSLIGFLIHRDEEAALKIFDILVQTENVPAEAMLSEEALAIADLKFIILSSLTKSALHWDWPILAASCLGGLLPDKRTQRCRPAVPALVADTISAILDKASQKDVASSLEACMSIIEMSSLALSVPFTLINRFYEIAAQHGQGRAAEALYHFSIQKAAHRKNPYPPPQGFALGWFLEHLSQHSDRVHLIRSLTEDVIERDLTVPTEFCARFVAINATAGNASLARTLYERFLRGPSWPLVVGNPILLIPMVRLFAALIKQTEVKIKDYERNTVLSKEQQETLEALNLRLKSLKKFSLSVFKRFKKQHLPLEEASHHILTTYVRACFVVGEQEEGIRGMQQLMNRREIPDIYDINVCINGISQNNPRRALDIVEEMVVGGRLMPDATTYGTIMSRALDHGDYELVDEMARKVKEIGLRRLSVKSLTGLVTAMTVEREGEPVEQWAKRVRETLEITEHWMGKHKAPSVQTGIHLVGAALKVDDPKAAFQFWTLIVREGMKWDDNQHRGIRQALVRSIVSHKERRLVTEVEHQSMISQIKSRKPLV
ncbi:hypothetical protein FA15DRAFT_665742 [Coprinopsis marcescibilis]|uniref:Pentacotripeptide-repeat region of PRORP domain-containing protein n=1 Tax=Coprinopsis marcescibilis TaxID=230819 RepID=A0A5C3L5B4_COPMA|nr:hypothetical protein FA15DRAFT_665742 [Coprinopsis marcescibilis]